jgi:hypothetical protein
MIPDYEKNFVSLYIEDCKDTKSLLLHENVSMQDSSLKLKE